MQEYSLQGMTIKLNLSQGVFAPSPTGLLLANNFKVKNNETFFDVGCGSGIFCILASKLGAKSVVGSDINAAAVESSRENAKLNNATNAEFFVGEFFGGSDDKCDVIVSNISQTPAPKDIEKTREIQDVDGGSDGADLICKLIELSKDHLTKGGRLYIPVVSLSNPNRTLSLISKLYNYNQLAKEEIAIPSNRLFLLPYFLELAKKGVCYIHKKNEIWHYTSTIYELKLK